MKGKVLMMEHAKAKGYIPIMVEVNSLHWLIVGGGTIATRKVNTLLRQGVTHITVVAPDLSEELIEANTLGYIKYCPDKYKISHLQGKQIVYAATDDHVLNRTICRDAKLYHLLVCNVSEQEQGSFITPSFFQREDIIFSVSSQGKSPIVTKIIGDEWAKYVDDRFAKQLPMLERLRQDLKRDIQQPALRHQILREATPQLLYDEIKDYNVWYTALLKHNC